MNERRDMPLVLPRPRRVTLTGGHIQADALKRIRGPEAFPVRGVPEGCSGYRLTINADGTFIESAGAAETRYALATIDQLARQYAGTMPAMVIEDWPSFATRGVMLDISRDRVPTMEHMVETVDLLASLKINHLQLYTEHTFAYVGHEDVWRGWSPITHGEARRLDAYCRERGIELSANQNCFGHLARWLNHPKYAPLAETTGDWVFQNETESFPRSGPFSLCPTDPKSIELIRDLLGQLLPCFTSPLVNIGCDETFDVGWGRSKAEVEKRGRAAVYFDFVNQIAEVVRSHGKRPMFWADIALTHPESITLIPKDMIGLAWGYEPDARFGEWCSRLREADREVWVCPGTSSWRSITGRTTERRANIRRAAREGAASGATGFLITDWGDSGHHQQWPIALNAIAEAADAAWNADNLDDYDPRAASLHVFGDESLRIGPWLDELGDVDLPLRQRGGRVNPGDPPQHLRNSSVLFCDLHMPTRPAKNDDEKLRRGIAGIPPDLWEHTIEKLHRLAASGFATSPERSDGSTTPDAPEHPTPPTRRSAPGSSVSPPAHPLTAELSHSLDVALFAAVRGLRRKTGQLTHTRRKDLRDRLEFIMHEHGRLWDRRSRSGGRADSLGFYQRILEDLKEEPS